MSALRYPRGVMLSSTFAGLALHRKALIDLAEAHDLHVREQEPHTAVRADARMLDDALETVRESAAYIGLIGQGGAVPLTERELDEAERLNQPILLFLMEEDGPRTLEPAAACRTGLEALRQRARAWDAQGAVPRACQTVTSLAAFRDAAAQAIPRLKAFLESRPVEAAAQREPGEHWPQALDFEAYIQRKRESFTGRAWLFAGVRQLLAEDGCRAVLLLAGDGMGKSAFMAEHAYRSRGQGLLGCH
jgi:hypothetical protein